MSSGRLTIIRLSGESWRECVTRYAKRRDKLITVALATMDYFLYLGEEEPIAAYHTLHKWDLLDFVPTAPATEDSD